jgi:hypothetical protein
LIISQLILFDADIGSERFNRQGRQVDAKGVSNNSLKESLFNYKIYSYVQKSISGCRHNVIFHKVHNDQDLIWKYNTAGNGKWIRVNKPVFREMESQRSDEQIFLLLLAGPSGG